jgi:hypothetical protein
LLDEIWDNVSLSGVPKFPILFLSPVFSFIVFVLATQNDPHCNRLQTAVQTEDNRYESRTVPLSCFANTKS